MNDNNYSFTDYFDDVYDKYNIIKRVFTFLLKISFILILSIWVFRLGTNSNATFISFTDLLTYLKECPNYYQALVDNLLSNIYYNGSFDSVNLPIIGGFLTFLGSVWNVLVYVFGAVVSSIAYLGYIFGVIFQF